MSAAANGSVGSCAFLQPIQVYTTRIVDTTNTCGCGSSLELSTILTSRNVAIRLCGGVQGVHNAPEITYYPMPCGHDWATVGVDTTTINAESICQLLDRIYEILLSERPVRRTESEGGIILHG